VNLTRLIILGLLAERGPSHGHQLRRDAELAEVERWGGVSVGSLHRELRAMESTGLVEAVRTEKIGRWPERTLYGITEEGRLELTVLRQQAVSHLDPPDPLCVALIFAGSYEPAELAALLARRKQAIQGHLERLAVERAAGEAAGYLLPEVSPLQAASFRRGELRLAAELAWHEEWEERLAAADLGAASKARSPSAASRLGGRARSDADSEAAAPAQRHSQ
jgi:DNA-binding PadR family transcriptional regulator